MKKNFLLAILVISCVFLSECRKDPKPDVFKITEVDVDASYRTAEIDGSYSFNLTPDDMRIVYGEKEDLTDAISFNVNVGESDFSVNIENLKTGTKYYYCFECYASHSSIRSEIHSFTTLKTDKPIVETSEISDITINFATGGGKVVSSCGEEVTARGVCWSTSLNPTINDNKTSDGTGTGTFTSRLSDLAAQTTYYVRAYATNAVGTAYGEQRFFTTKNEVSIPVTATISVDDITMTSAEVKAEVISDGGANVTARGVCWSTSHNPTINDSKTNNGSGTGSFTSNLTNLTENTTYYVRAYATNSVGTAYGDEIGFTTLKDIVPPTVQTKDVANVTQNAAVGGGVVLDDGGANVTARGVCWSISHNPTVSDSHTSNGTGEGEFQSNMTGLVAGTTYYVRAYAVNSAGTAYGEEKSFVTNIVMDLPLVTTKDIDDITETTATSGGEVISDGGAAVIARGVCWSTSQNPTINDNKTNNGSGTGSFTSNLTNLTENTTYYVRAYATNSVGTAYGEQRSFTTEEEEVEETICEPDGDISGYGYVDLGLPSGLKWATCNVGATSAEDYGDYFAWGETTTKSDYSSSNSLTYGLSKSQLQSQGYIDGSGNLTSQHDAATANWGGSWRMPTKAELEELKNNCTWEWTQVNGVNGYKVTGPNGSCIFLPAAGCRLGSSLIYGGYYGGYWSSTPLGSNSDYAYGLDFGSDYQRVYYSIRDGGLSVRPVSDGNQITPEPALPTVVTSSVSDVTSNTANCGGNVTSDGGAAVIARGVCWSTSQNPTIYDSKTNNGSGTGTFTSQLSNLIPQTTYYVRAYATNSVGTAYGEQRSFTTEEKEEEETICEPDGDISGHGYVDLGLPSGLKWATCNVGATSAEDYGDYFAWGETTTKSDYSSSNSLTYGLSKSQLQSQGYIDGSGNLTSQHDAATANWGGSWRMPTKEECRELVDHCEWEWTQVNGVYGSKFTGPNGSCIFLPAAGDRDGSSLYVAGRYGYFWSSTPYESNSYSACCLGFGSGYRNVGWYDRYLGQSVRPVSDGNQITPEPALPTVVTSSVSDVTSNTANCGGNVTSDGGAAVIARGVCWSTSQNPTLDDNDGITTDGSGTGTFVSLMECLESNTTYYVRAYATNEKGTGYGDVKNFTTQQGQMPSGTINGHDYVDLGLPSGLKWATCNIGASFPREYGNYYAWGEITTKTEYTKENSLTYGENVGNNISGDPQYDAATANWGDEWRMPTEEEMEELIDECNWELIEICEHKVFKVRGPSDNYILLPLAGQAQYYEGENDPFPEEGGRYWSATGSGTTSAKDLAFDANSSYQRTGPYYRYGGRSIRPVSDGNQITPEPALPTVVTSSVSDVTSNTANCGGNVTSDGGAAVIARGVCWSTSQNPTINDNKTNNGSGTGSFTSNLTNLTENTTYYVRAYATNSVGTAYGEQRSFTTEEEEEEETICEPDGDISGYGYVDLGLPSGLKWATCNVGATSAEDYGDYFAWGETTTKSDYSSSNSLTYGLSKSQLQSQGYIDGSGNLTSQHDAATANWGGSWRMPTKAELEELKNNCTWEWTQVNGVNGYKVTGPNGSCIFLPAAGDRFGSLLFNDGDYGCYWSSTPDEGDSDDAYGLYVDSGYQYVDYDDRYVGRSVRPVSE